LQNTPPNAQITGFDEGYLYSVIQPTELLLNADVWDAETPTDELDVEWRVFLHHNSHFHLENTSTGPNSVTTIQPLGCGIEKFWYRIQLTVSDPQGLQAQYQREIFPDCEGVYSPYAPQLTIYPNPATDFFRIRLEQPFDEWVDISIYNDIGEVVQSKRYYPAAGMFDFRFTTDGLEAGVYVVACSSEKWLERKKLMISNQ
jgi:hypothetical protein